MTCSLTPVENFPGFPNGILGSELMEKFREQSLRFGTEIITETVSKVDLSQRPFRYWREGQEDEEPSSPALAPPRYRHRRRSWGMLRAQSPRRQVRYPLLNDPSLLVALTCVRGRPWLW